MKIEQKVANFENKPDDSRKMFETIKTIKKITPKQPHLLHEKSRLIENEEEQANIIAAHFKIQFFKNAKKLQMYTPVKMKTLFNLI